MRLQKKMFSAFMVLVMFFNCSQCFFAADREDNANSKLEELGYSAIMIEKLGEDEKQIICDENLYFGGAKLFSYEEETGIFTEISLDEEGISPRGQISTSNMELLFTYTIGYNSDQSVSYIRVFVGYNWLKNPACRWEDPIGVSWDGDKFDVVSGSFEKYDKYDYYPAGILPDEITGETFSYETTPASIGEDGLTWFADLKGDTLITVSRLYGYGTFKLSPINGSGTSTMYIKYLHPTIITIGLSLNVSSYGVFTVSGVGTYDEQSSSASVTWSK